MSFAIIIVNWNVKTQLRDCLQSVQVALHADELTADVWVVDSASSDGSATMVETEFPWVRLIASETNLGFAGGNNAALRAMGFPNRQADQPEAVLLLNPDTLVDAGAFPAMLDVLTRYAAVGVVGAKLRFGDGTFQHGAYGFPGLWQLAIELFPLPGRLYQSQLNGRYPRAAYDSGQPFPIDHPLGAAMLVRAQAIWQAGLLDESYFMYVEEVDWAWRIKQTGWLAMAAPAATIVHLGGQSTGQIKRDSTLHLWTSRQRFYHGHYPRWKYALARQLVHWGMRRQRMLHPEHHQTFEQVARIWS